MNILLVEDNESIAKGLKYTFDNYKYKLVYKTTIKEAGEYLSNGTNVDLIIMDVTLPDGNGFDFFNNFIKKIKIPTIFLTACDEESDIVGALEGGAEDYVIKPFSIGELMARINKILLRYKKQTIVKSKEISFDMDKLELYKGCNPIKLTALELKLVNLLFTNINKVISRNILLDKIWEWTGNDVDDHTVTVYIKRIREKMGTDTIKTVKGIGYRIDEE